MKKVPWHGSWISNASIKMFAWWRTKLALVYFISRHSWSLFKPTEVWYRNINVCINVKSYVQLKNGCGVFLGHHMAWRPHEFLIDPEEGKLSLSFFFSCMSFFLFHILLLCLFCSSLIFLPNYDGPGWTQTTQTDLNQHKRSWTSSQSDHLIILCNLMAAISENLFRLFWIGGFHKWRQQLRGREGVKYL